MNKDEGRLGFRGVGLGGWRARETFSLEIMPGAGEPKQQTSVRTAAAKKRARHPLQSQEMLAAQESAGR